MSYFPPSLPPRIPETPKQAAERRARTIANVKIAAYWTALALPVLFALMVFGYSDQAPAALRRLVIMVDGVLGQPIWSLIRPAP